MAPEPLRRELSCAPRVAGRRDFLRSLGLMAGGLWLDGAGAQQAELAAPYVPTPPSVVTSMLELAGVTRDDTVVDLGSGDGRIVIEAAKRYGARGLGLDISPGLVKLANENALKAGVSNRVKFFVGDLFSASLSQASVVVVYLLPKSVERLVPKLYNDLAPGTRVVSHDYELPPLKPVRLVELDVPEKQKITGTPRTFLYLYVIAAPVAGRWATVLPKGLGSRETFVFGQEFDQVNGYVERPDGRVQLQDVMLTGNQLRFVVPVLGEKKDVAFQLAVRDATMQGTAAVSGVEMQVVGLRDGSSR